MWIYRHVRIVNSELEANNEFGKYFLIKYRIIAAQELEPQSAQNLLWAWNDKKAVV